MLYDKCAPCHHRGDTGRIVSQDERHKIQTVVVAKGQAHPRLLGEDFPQVSKAIVSASAAYAFNPPPAVSHFNAFSLPLLQTKSRSASQWLANRAVTAK